MYRSFEAGGFRCFDHLRLDGLERVNLIAGMNNVGKTALLEALFLHCGAYNPELTLRVNAFRGLKTVKLEFGLWAETPWDSLFGQFDASKTLELAGEGDAKSLGSLRLKLLRTPSELAEAERSMQYPAIRDPGPLPRRSPPGHFRPRPPRQQRQPGESSHRQRLLRCSCWSTRKANTPASFLPLWAEADSTLIRFHQAPDFRRSTKAPGCVALLRKRLSVLASWMFRAGRMWYYRF